MEGESCVYVDANGYTFRGIEVGEIQHSSEHLLFGRVTVSGPLKFFLNLSFELKIGKIIQLISL